MTRLVENDALCLHRRLRFRPVGLNDSERFRRRGLAEIGEKSSANLIAALLRQRGDTLLFCPSANLIAKFRQRSHSRKLA